MHYLIAGGTGFIGQALTNFWLQKGHSVSVLGRSLSYIQQTFGQKVSALSWQDLTDQRSRLLYDKDAIVNLAGANIGSARWTSKRQAQLLSSRLLPTELLASCCAELGSQAPLLLNASGCGIYGLQTTLGQVSSDTSACLPQAAGFLAALARSWEQALAAAQTAGVRVFALRFGVALAKHGGVLAKLLPVYKLGLGGRYGTGQQPFAWISLVDLCRAIDFICSHPMPTGAINLVAPKTLSQIEFSKLLAQALHRPSKMVYPAWLLRLLLGQMAEELLLHGQQAIPTRLLEQDFSFHHPDLQSFLAATLP